MRQQPQKEKQARDDALMMLEIELGEAQEALQRAMGKVQYLMFLLGRIK